MKTWIFAGICDKSELLLYVCMLLRAAGQKVLLVDATEKRKYPLYIGQLDKPLSVTEFSGFDVASGFADEFELREHLAIAGTAIEQYDVVVFDMEQPDFCPRDSWESAAALVWVSDYEIWTLERGRGWLEDLLSEHLGSKTLEFYKVYVRAADEFFDEGYAEGYFGSLPVRWKEASVAIPWVETDYALKLRNDHTRKVRIRPLSRIYKKNLCLLMRHLTDMELKSIHRALRSAERSKA
ncbi:hypothetical protein FHS19_002553 [Paenibacillus rhizosphaerae]|uniref:CobQ/CobB/MinD/ParA nucleotide binding domain-containing protein n=1 Tax=Paenibacillus rhizosphaerae TaxID=297318 RepID=A0A839TRF0_9BACL|nr:hypothetical protein [Paenibacillus rhizosphaerae]MBB3127899.1 hypothetical protein [Paenibacillus rhizosphaerae]